MLHRTRKIWAASYMDKQMTLLRYGGGVWWA
ncbi:hypothetical protein FIV06_22570 [Labrenzia sp. THAF191b]|nr:hypothetical protein FIV06_22570 [Labrenzia sp. THAF191b]QFT06542.1 hypothetical protein FIV05_22565 [Labrenzia sp. THAF191a]QFT18086.1 hypothetical protein FIV03_22580 [Labrenzia sp. THAF187b]